MVTIGANEVCDDGANNGHYKSSGTTSYCKNDCSGRIAGGTEYFCGDKIVQLKQGDDRCYDSQCKYAIPANYPGAIITDLTASEQCDSADVSTDHLCDIYMELNGKSIAPAKSGSRYYNSGSISCNACKISTSDNPCGYCGDGVYQSGKETCENTAAGIQYGAASTDVFDQKDFTYSSTSSGNWTVKISGIYKIQIEGGKGGQGGNGRAGEYSDQETGSVGSSGSVVARQYFLQSGTILSFTAGTNGNTGTGGGSGRSGATPGGSGGSLNGQTGNGGSDGEEHSICGDAGGGGAGGGGGGAAYLKIGSDLILTANGGAGGQGGKGGGGKGGLCCAGGNQQDGGSGGSGGTGGVYDSSHSNWASTSSGTGWKYDGTASSDSASGSSKFTVKLVKYAPCKSDCTFETNASNFINIKKRTVNCTGLPANAEWNTASSITQNFGSTWTPQETGTHNETPSTTECRYKCKSGYNWNGSACVNTRVVDCPLAGRPTENPEDGNWEWNTVAEITQNWDGSGWTPADTVSYSDTPTTSECRFRCKEGFTYQQNDYTYTQNGTTTTVEGNHCKNERIVNCTGLPAHATWWGETEKHGTPAEHTITQHWTQANGWQNTTTGSYSASNVAGECRFHCNKNYTWSNGQCVANKRTTVACGTKPGNTDWNDSGKNGKFEQTWSDTGLGSETCNAAQWANNDCWFPRSKSATYQPTTAAECGYKCSADFHTENSGATCISDYMDPNDPSSECNAGGTDRCKCEYLPTGGIANTATRIARHWDGTKWLPVNSYANNYSTTPRTDICAYQCWADATHHFEWNGSACVGQDTTETCTGLPEHATWWAKTEHHGNPDAHTITQTWTNVSGTWKWMPVKEGAYSASNPNKPNECWFHCNKNYTWSNGQCVANKRTTVACGYGKPAHSTWNDGGKNGKFEQTWNELASADCNASQWAADNCWFPRSKNSNHNATAGECIYKCNTNYTWNNSQSSSACNANTNTYTCTGKTDGTEWNSVSSYTQTWDEDHAGCNPSVTDPADTNSCWYPQATSATYNTTASTTECRYKCDSTHTRYNNACVNSRSGQSCTGNPANTRWSSNNSTSKTITQTWTPANGWQPSLTGTHNTATDANQCYFQCEGETLATPHYDWNGTSCDAHQLKDRNCTGLPAHNSAFWQPKITQTWNGSTFAPTLSATYSASQVLNECHFKCINGYGPNTAQTDCQYCNDGAINGSETCDGSNFTHSYTLCLKGSVTRGSSNSCDGGCSSDYKPYIWTECSRNSCATTGTNACKETWSCTTKTSCNDNSPSQACHTGV